MQIMIGLWMICVVYCHVWPGWGNTVLTFFALPSPKKTSFITILWGDNAENEGHNYNNQSHTKRNACNERNSIKISYRHINLFLNLLQTPGVFREEPLGRSSDPHWEALMSLNMLQNAQRRLTTLHKTQICVDKVILKLKIILYVW